MGKIVVVKTCKECGTSFNISEGEVKFLQDHGLAIFERCMECRKKRKEQQEEREKKRAQTN